MTGVVRAAGGVVARRSADGALEVVVVHRLAYGDWTFPKGKADETETDAEAALREVFEETSLECRLVRELGTTRYHDSRGRPKEVRYWQMAPVHGELEASNEIDAARWAAVDEARSLLTYARDVAILDALEAE
jgi:8-oxo-dGTP diphosphatase